MSHFKTILAIDHDKPACATYKANFSDTEVRCATVASELHRLPYADIIVGGPPCVSFSLAGKGLGEADERNGWPDYVRAVAKVRPRMALAENVAGMMTEAHRPYLGRIIGELEKLDYVVEWKMLDSVSFGVPQFRERIFIWCIRRDVYEAGARHCWPKPTHVWPWPDPKQGSMFGGELLPAITCGMALGIDGSIRRRRSASVERPLHPSSEPGPCITDMSGGGSASGFDVIGGGSNPSFPGDDRTERVISDEPSTTLAVDAGNAMPRIIGAGRHDVIPKTTRNITDEPSQTIVGQWQDHQQPRVQEYHWSDAMLQKHPPASPASPAPTVQAKFLKGGAEGLVEIVADPKHPMQQQQPANALTSGGNGHGPTENCLKLSMDGRTWDSRHPPATPATPATTIRARSPRDGGRCTENVIREKLLVRRLTPAECQRLMSAPDDFKWPEKISKTAKYRILGNGQASLLMSRLADAMHRADPESRTIVSLFCGGGIGDIGFSHGRYWSYDPFDFHPPI